MVADVEGQLESPSKDRCCIPFAFECADEECQEAVCKVDPACCVFGWDNPCVGLALELCPACAVCGAPASEDCCEAHSSPFCNDAACCEKVCAEAPYCCETAWDEGCVFGAKLLCGCPEPEGCAGFCGGQSPDGCWCDPPCCGFSDCCPDESRTCSNCVEHGCNGFCGGASFGCFCDESCFAFSDCCADICANCAVLQSCGGPGVCDAADITGDHVVGGADLGLLLLNWGDCPNGTDGCPGDISFDGEVDGADLGNLLLNWGECR